MKDLVKHMVDRFCGWTLPRDFYPDHYISFDRERATSSPGWPTGTNLFHAGQAQAMFEYCMQGAVESAQDQTAASTQPAGAPAQAQPDLKTFTAWLEREIPPGTIISNPAWWAPKVLRAALSASPSAPAVQADDHRCKFPLCQSEEYQTMLAEQIKRELYTGSAAPLEAHAGAVDTARLDFMDSAAFVSLHQYFSNDRLFIEVECEPESRHRGDTTREALDAAIAASQQAPAPTTDEADHGG